MSGEHQSLRWLVIRDMPRIATDHSLRRGYSAFLLHLANDVEDGERADEYRNEKQHHPFLGDTMIVKDVVPPHDSPNAKGQRNYHC